MNHSLINISIIIPNFNRGDFLSATLDSVLRQNYDSWEAIVVDDGSTDSSKKVMEDYSKKDNRIRCFTRDRKPGGAPVCRNIGVEKSTGDFLIFLDSDDLLADFCLSQRAETIRKFPENDFWVFPMLMFKDDPKNARNLWNKETEEQDLFRFLKLDAVWQTSGPIWRKKAVEKIGGFTEGLACWQDVDFHLKALTSKLKYQKYYHLKPDIFYRMHEVGSISQGEISSLPKLLARKEILISHFNKSEALMGPELMKSFGILARSVSFGAAKTLHYKITFSVLSFGIKNKILSLGFVTKTFIFQMIVLGRINRIPGLGKLIKSLFQPISLDSNIGKHAYIKQ